MAATAEQLQTAVWELQAAVRNITDQQTETATELRTVTTQLNEYSSQEVKNAKEMRGEIKEIKSIALAQAETVGKFQDAMTKMQEANDAWLTRGDEKFKETVDGIDWFFRFVLPLLFLLPLLILMRSLHFTRHPLLD